ncbi:hypothetical protein Tco_0691942 [Tanacetum coccineum]
MATKSVLKDVGKDIGHREVRPVWNSAQRINHQNKFVSSAVLTKSGRVPISAVKQSSQRAAASTSVVRPVNTAIYRNRVNASKSRTNTFHKSHSPIRRPFYKSTTSNTRISNEKVNAVRVNGVNTAGQKAISAVKGIDNSGSWISKRVDYIDLQGKLKYMTGNKDFLTDYQEIDGGFVSFGGSTRGGKITGKGKIRTGQGPNWIFDIDSLTNSMNYQPVTAGNQTNKNAGPKKLMVNTDETDEDDTADDAAGEKPIQKPASENEQALKNVLDKMMDQEKEAKEQSNVVIKEFEA